MVYMSDLKWYPGYSDVEIINSAIHSLSPNEAAILVIGEDGVRHTTSGDLDALELETFQYVTVDGMDGDPVTTPFADLVASFSTSHPEAFV